MEIQEFNCPIPKTDTETILLSHGGGGKHMNQLIENVFHAAFKNDLLDQKHDGAVFKINGTRLAFATDSFVVDPLFFPGGDIGSLAVHGTINDLAMCGAQPLFLSAAFILEEGFPLDALKKITVSMQTAAEQCNVKIITGDTKVVDKGKADQLFINTAGIGILHHNRVIHPSQIEPGDAILINGDIARHGIAIMAQREGLAFESTIQSDSAPLADTVKKLLDAGINLHCLRDLTRGGLSSALIEIAQLANKQIEINEKAIPIQEEVRGACEILGLDPFYIANEGRFVAFIPSAEAGKALSLVEKASIIGEVTSLNTPLVTVKNSLGATRILDMLTGEQLPRIC